MKLKIKIKLNDISQLPTLTKKGDWIDLKAAETVEFKAPQAETLHRKTINNETSSFRDVIFDRKLIPLGVMMQLPKGFEAVILPRSSTPNDEPKGFGIISANSQGVIDNKYCGDNDQWYFNAIALRHTIIKKGYRICQFRIQLSQYATIWQKIKWLFSNGIEFKITEHLNHESRGGFGSTGLN